MPSPGRSNVATWLAALALTAPLGHAGGVRILDPLGNRDFHTIQQAVDAAVDGDVLLVGPGAYPPFTVAGKSLSILAPNLGVQVLGTVTIRDLPATALVLVAGISSTGSKAPTSTSCGSPAPSGPGLVLKDNEGEVRLQGCNFLGGAGTLLANNCSGLSGAGGDGAQVLSTARAIFVGGTLRGGAGAGPSCCSDYNSRGGKGGNGVASFGSGLMLYGTATIGGPGGPGGAYGGDGGEGASVYDFGVLAVGGSFVGGKGGDAWDFLGVNGGDGGHGLHVQPQAQAHLLDNAYTGGAYGVTHGIGSNGAPGQGLLAQGGVTQHAGKARRIAIQRAVNSDTSLHPLTATGEPGDRLFLLQSLQPGFRALIPLQPAALFLGKPFPVPLSPALVLSSPGPVPFTFPTGDLHGTSLARLVYLQGRTSPAGGGVMLGNPLHALVISRQHPPDCNGNGTNDYVETVLGTVPDIDKNLVPDSCDPDCNGNGIIDGYEVLTGAVPDCDDNGVPDACDIASGAAEDCNGNGVPDSCDIASGASSDQNGNGIPDECEPANTIVWVDAAAPPGGNGTMAAPYRTLREGIGSSFDGNTVMVRDGLYTGPDNRDIDFGGRSIVLRSEKGPASCVIDCAGLGRAFLLQSGESNATRIQGFTIRNGSGEGYGGAILAVIASPTIGGCVFQSCSTIGSGGGGAVALFRSGRIESCSFVGNSAPLGDGGAVRVVSYPSAGGVAVVGCTFSRNSAQRGGALEAVNGADPCRITHCRFLENSADIEAGALRLTGVASAATSFVSNCLFAGNSSGGEGGAVAARTAPLPLVVGCTFTANSADMRGGALAFCGASMSLRSCVLWSNAAPAGSEIAFGLAGSCSSSILDVAWCDVQGGQAGVSVPTGTLQWGPGNLDLDPLFADPDGPDDDPLTFLDNDYRLASGSPCIDAGDNLSVPPDLLDLDGDGDTGEPTPIDLAGAPRFADDPAAPDVGNGAAPLVDLGAFERP